jgi:SAM-dependent methyltransferase
MSDTWKLYDKIVEWFDNNRSKELMEKEYVELVLKHIPKRGAILDLGCGTAEPLAQFFIQHGFYITGVDGSPKMIDLCKKRFPDMKWIVGDMRVINLHQKFDAVIAWDSFFHLNQDDQKNMFTVFNQHLQEEGILLFTSGTKREEVYGNMDGHNFYHASLDLNEYRNLLKENGFEILLNKIEDPACGMHTVWVARKKK